MSKSNRKKHEIPYLADIDNYRIVPRPVIGPVLSGNLPVWPSVCIFRFNIRLILHPIQILMQSIEKKS